MNLQKLNTENTEQYIWRLGQAKDSGELDMSWDELSKIINIQLGNEDNPYSEASYRKPYQQAKRFFDAGVFSNNKGYPVDRTTETSINKDGSYSSNKLIEMTEEQSKNSDFMLEAHGFDKNEWKIVSARNTIRQVISKQDGIVTLYSSFITVKPLDCNEISLNKINDFFQNLDRKYSLPNYTRVLNNIDGNKLLLIDIADLHMNLLASTYTTGNEYNCDIAENLFFYVINDILTRTENYKFKEIVFTIGGDMLNADNLAGTTTKGTPQNNHLHYYDAFDRLCSMTVKAIDILANKAKVNVIYVSGNHDEVTGYKLAKYIEAWFRNDNNITVDSRPFARKYKVFGKTLLCFAHDADVKRLPMIIADEAREYWSSIDTTEVFLQHLHTEIVLFEEYNMRIQRVPTISGHSKWSSDKGYSSKRQNKSFIFDIDDGLINVLYTPIKLS